MTLEVVCCADAFQNTVWPYNFYSFLLYLIINLSGFFKLTLTMDSPFTRIFVFVVKINNINFHTLLYLFLEAFSTYGKIVHFGRRPCFLLIPC